MAKAGDVGGSVEGCDWLKKGLLYVGNQEFCWLSIKTMKTTDRKAVTGGDSRSDSKR